jgi:hypothetical protein
VRITASRLHQVVIVTVTPIKPQLLRDPRQAIKALLSRFHIVLRIFRAALGKRSSILASSQLLGAVLILGKAVFVGRHAVIILLQSVVILHNAGFKLKDSA